MYYKIVNVFDVDMLLEAVEAGCILEIKNMPEDYQKACSMAAQSLREQILRFDTFYTEQRSPDADLGGYAYFIPTLEDATKFFDRIKERHNITDMPSEYADIVAENTTIEFIEELFILSADFAIICTYPRRKNR